LASETRKPVAIRFWTVARFLLVEARVCSAVIAAALVFKLDMNYALYFVLKQHAGFSPADRSGFMPPERSMLRSVRRIYEREWLANGQETWLTDSIFGLFSSAGTKEGPRLRQRGLSCSVRENLKMVPVFVPLSGRATGCSACWSWRSTAPGC